jgi:hypothetical protein
MGRFRKGEMKRELRIPIIFVQRVGKSAMEKIQMHFMDISGCLAIRNTIHTFLVNTQIILNARL